MYVFVSVYVCVYAFMCVRMYIDGVLVRMSHFRDVFPYVKL